MAFEKVNTAQQAWHRRAALGRRRRRFARRSAFAKFSENLLVVLSKQRWRRIDARTAMSKGESRDGHRQFPLHARAWRVAVNDAAGCELRIGQRFAHRAHARRWDMARLQELLPFGGAARRHD